MGKKAKLTFWGSLACAVVGVAAVVWPPFAPFAPYVIGAIGGLTGTNMLTHAYSDVRLSQHDPKKAGK